MFNLGSVEEITETDVETAVCSYARSLGWVNKKFKSPSNRNEPDQIFFRNSRIVLIEFKRPGKGPRRAQRRKLQQYRDMGFHAVWCNDIAEGNKIFRDIDAGLIKL